MVELILRRRAASGVEILHAIDALETSLQRSALYMDAGAIAALPTTTDQASCSAAHNSPSLRRAHHICRRSRQSLQEMRDRDVKALQQVLRACTVAQEALQKS